MAPRNSASNSSTSHSSISLISSSMFHILLLFRCEFHYYSKYCLLLCHTGTSVLMLLPPPGYYWYTSFFFLAVPDHFRKIAVSTFSRSPSGRANTFSFLRLRLNPRMFLFGKCLSGFTLSLSASLSLLSILSSASALYLPNFSTDITSSLFPPVPFHTFSTTLSHLIPARHLVTFPHTAVSTMAGNFFFGMFLLLYCRFNFIMSLFSICLECVHSRFCSSYCTSKYHY